jgi:hypothetical protein
MRAGTASAAAGRPPRAECGAVPGTRHFVPRHLSLSERSAAVSAGVVEREENRLQLDGEAASDNLKTREITSSKFPPRQRRYPLTQRVQGSSPCAPTGKINNLFCKIESAKLKDSIRGNIRATFGSFAAR